MKRINLGLLGMIGCLGLMASLAGPAQACVSNSPCALQATAPTEAESVAVPPGAYNLHTHYAGLKERTQQAPAVGLRLDGLHKHSGKDRLGWSNSLYRPGPTQPRLQAEALLAKAP